MGAFRGWFSLAGVEIANTNRVVSHLGRETPTNDLGIFGDPEEVVLIEDPPGSGLYLPTLPLSSPGTYLPTGLTEDPDAPGLYFDPDTAGEQLCALTPHPDHPGMFYMPDTAYPMGNLFAPPDGSRQWSAGIYAIDGRCWGPGSCRGCDAYVRKEDGWDGLREFLGDTAYRPEIAPWYSTRVPESGEFIGVWIMSVEGLDATPIDVTISDSVGHGATAGKSRAGSRKLSFEALVLACTPAGMEYGKEWLGCQLKLADTPTGVVMRYFSANPRDSVADAAGLLREAHNVVYSGTLTTKDEAVPTAHRVNFELTVTSPFIYYPRVDVAVEWSEMVYEPINWVHHQDCLAPEHCTDMPVLFSADCVPEVIEVVTSPPPVCGGCMPVCAIERYVFRPPTREFPLRCHETAVNMTITNTGPDNLTVQGYWRVCGTDERCDDNRFQVQIAGLPPTATIVLDSITGKYHALVDGVPHQAVGIVSTPTGAPWRPTIIDRSICWEFVLIAPPGTEFDATMTLADRTP